MIARGADTIDTSVHVEGVSASALLLLACTPDTSDTPKNGEPVTSASNSVAAPPAFQATMPCLVIGRAAGRMGGWLGAA